MHVEVASAPGRSFPVVHVSRTSVAWLGLHPHAANRPTDRPTDLPAAQLGVGPNREEVVDKVHVALTGRTHERAPPHVVLRSRQSRQGSKSGLSTAVCLPVCQEMQTSKKKGWPAGAGKTRLRVVLSSCGRTRVERGAMRMAAGGSPPSPAACCAAAWHGHATAQHKAGWRRHHFVRSKNKFKPCPQACLHVNGVAGLHQRLNARQPPPAHRLDHGD